MEREERQRRESIRRDRVHPPPKALPFPVAFRLLVDSDMGFVVKGWLSSYHDGTQTMKAVPFHRFKREQRAIIRDALDRGQCVVACEPSDHATLYGFAAGWDDIGVGVAHYVYVLQTRRSMGLARALLHELGRSCGRTMTTYSHSTVQGAGLARHLNLRHDPFALVRMIYASDGTVRDQAAPNRDGGEPAGVVPPRRAAGGG